MSVRICTLLPICRLVNSVHMRNIRAMATETLYPVKKLVNLTDEQASAIADFRFSKRLHSENEAIRQLIELGLEAAKQRQKEVVK